MGTSTLGVEGDGSFDGVGTFGDEHALACIWLFEVPLDVCISLELWRFHSMAFPMKPPITPAAMAITRPRIRRAGQRVHRPCECRLSHVCVSDTLATTYLSCWSGTGYSWAGSLAVSGYKAPFVKVCCEDCVIHVSVNRSQLLKAVGLYTDVEYSMSRLHHAPSIWLRSWALNPIV